MQTKTLWMMAGQWLSVSMLFIAGCATSQEVAGVREDLQKGLQEARTKYEQSSAQSEAKQKAAEELQAQLTKDLRNQEQSLATLATKVQDLHLRQETSQKERASTQGTNLALRDSILRALKTEQYDLQQRLKRLGDHINNIERAETVGVVEKPASSPAPMAEPTKQDRLQVDGQAPKGAEEPKGAK